IIVGLGFRVFAEPEHAGERCQADCFRRVRIFAAAEEKRGVDIDRSVFARFQEEFVGTGATCAFEKSKKMKRVALFVRLAEPPGAEGWEFLGTIGLPAVNGEAAR